MNGPRANLEREALPTNHRAQPATPCFVAGLATRETLAAAAYAPPPAQPPSPSPPVPAASLADKAMSAIRGGQDAQRLLFAMSEGIAPADALFEGLQAVLATGDLERLRGFVRQLQKRLERVA